MLSLNVSLGGGLPGSQPKGGLLGGGGGPTGGSGMVGSNARGKNREILRLAFGNDAYRFKNGSQLYPLRKIELNSSGVPSTFLPRTTPFRIATNSGDILGTVNKPANTEILPAPANQITSVRRNSLNGWKFLAGSARTVAGGGAYVGNPKYVYDGEDYVRYKKLSAINKNYNDLSFGGNDSNAQQQPIRFVRTH